jgi:hypothetical protein
MPWVEAVTGLPYWLSVYHRFPSVSKYGSRQYLVLVHFSIHQPKQFDREHILVFFSENLGFFRFVSVCFGLFQNSLFLLFRFYTETESFNISIEPKQRVSIEPKQTEDQPKQFDREHFSVFFRKFRVVSVCFETVLFCFGCFDIPKQRVSIFQLTRNREFRCFD